MCGVEKGSASVMQSSPSSLVKGRARQFRAIRTIKIDGNHPFASDDVKPMLFRAGEAGEDL